MSCQKCENNIGVNPYRRIIGFRRVWKERENRETIEPFYGPEESLCYAHFIAALRRDKAQRAPLKVYEY
jgi:hypothetical protein